MWTSLQILLASNPSPIPPVLAGPILRRVTETDVTVWFATRYPATITVRVFAPGGAQVMGGDRHTTRIGSHLYIVAVTALSTQSTSRLQESTIYEYDAVFDFDALSTGVAPSPAEMSLAEATHNASLSYLPSKRPSFCLPPTDVNKLRIIHGSCRHSNGDGRDALAEVNRLIAQAALVADERPHQLLLGGDQLYADDVGADLLLLLTDASDALLGWQEHLPVPRNATWTDEDATKPRTKLGKEIPPYARAVAARQAGFTSDMPFNHIMTLGEYIAMYLFGWSDVLWDSKNIPAMSDIKAAIDTLSPEDDKVPQAIRNQGLFFSFTVHDMFSYERRHATADGANLREFRRRLADVRRALANIPTYMILDDHDVTDDFNMTRDIALGVYGNPLGRRVITNAMVAYALCQHWGNVPNQFDAADPLSPGMRLLRQFEDPTAQTNIDDGVQYDQREATLASLVGVHDDKGIMSATGGPAARHDAGALTYNYTIEGRGHQIIVTDTRTWRAFPNSGDEASVLLPQSQIDAQIRNTPPLNGRALIVVLTTNIPPIPPIRFATRNPSITNALRFSPDIFESWELPSFPTDHLLKALTDKLLVVNGVASGPVILLSGDVHHSFATRLLFTATARLGDPNPGVAVKAVIAQLISSSLRNQTDETLDIHRAGYDYRSGLIGEEHRAEAYVGWNITAPEQVMTRHPAPFVTATTIPTSILNVKLHASRTIPVRVMKKTEGATYLRTPDWGYRLDYLPADVQNPFPISTVQLQPLPPGATAQQRSDAANVFKQVVGDYRNFTKRNTKREIVGVTNVSELTFDWPAGDKKHAIHTVRWYDPDNEDEPPMVTTYAVSLDPNDSKYTFESISGVKVGP
jgi:hypothetical protein